MLLLDWIRCLRVKFDSTAVGSIVAAINYRRSLCWTSSVGSQHDAIRAFAAQRRRACSTAPAAHRQLSTDTYLPPARWLTQSGAPCSRIRHTHGWRRGVVGSGVRRMNEVNARRARLVPGWVTVFGRVYHLGM